MSFIYKLPLIILVTTGCATYNGPTSIKHSPSGATVEVSAGVPVKDAGQIIQFLYKNFKTIEKNYHSTFQSSPFTTLYKIGIGSKTPELGYDCTYTASFKFIIPPSKMYSGIDFCIHKTNNEKKPFEIQYQTTW